MKPQRPRLTKREREIREILLAEYGYWTNAPDVEAREWIQGVFIGIGAISNVFAAIVRGEKPPEKRIDTGAKVVTKANMTQPEIHKLLFPLEK